MSPQQVRVYLDEDVDVLVATLLRARGCEAEHAAETGLRGATDQEQLEHAAASGRAIVTHNRVHFEALAAERFEREQSHAGIIIAGRRPVHELSRRLLTLLSAFSASDLVNQIRYI